MLAGPSARGGGVVRFEAPVYFERGGLAIHPPWGAWGPDHLGPPYVISALPMGWRVGAFRRLDDAEKAFLALESLVNWRRLGPRGTARHRPAVRRAVVAVLEKYGADFLRATPKMRTRRALEGK